MAYARLHQNTHRTGGPVRSGGVVRGNVHGRRVEGSCSGFAPAVGTSEGSRVVREKFGRFWLNIRFILISEHFLQIKASFGINHFQVKYFDEDNEEVKLKINGLSVLN